MTNDLLLILFRLSKISWFIKIKTYSSFLDSLFMTIVWLSYFWYPFRICLFFVWFLPIRFTKKNFYMQTLNIETCMSMTFPKNILWMVSDHLVDYRIRVLAVPPSELREIQTGFFVHWAKNAKYLGRRKNFRRVHPI